MLSPQLRRQVFDLWSMFWAAGMTNPLTAIEQITYLLFLKQLENLDIDRVKAQKRSIYGRRRNCTLPHHPDEKRNPDQSIPEGADPAEYAGCPGHGTCHWAYIRQATTVTDDAGRPITPHDHLSQYVFPWLRALEETLDQMSNGANGLREAGEYMEDAYFQLPREKTATLQKAIAAIDELFQYVGSRSANADIMGDIFEYLLSEIQTSGKNGQFRTPRHIIRFMISLVDPKPGERIVDPAAGTAGFLINSIQHLLKQHTDPESLVLEWDGTPHRLYGGDPALEQYLTGHYFTGYDNDRTMVRIGWMNMVLHGIERPAIHLKDSLGKSLDTSESGSYDVALANPPFTGTVDEGDLNQTRFPRKNSKEPITNKTELLFVWLLLDLLKTGGRAAVIVPEGVLFGSTGAHRELRRQLLFAHQLEAVISLPAGVFQPYTGVKTSILVFQKVGSPTGRGIPPRTDRVWFYEVTADGFSLDAKRDARPEPNDLWDAVAKWPEKRVETADYYQPEIFPVRWRLVDNATVRLFPQLVAEKDQIWGIHELFRELPRNPDEADALVRSQQEPSVFDLYREFLASQPLGRLPGMPARTRQEIEKAIQPIHSRINITIKDLLEMDTKTTPRRFCLRCWILLERLLSTQWSSNYRSTQPSAPVGSSMRIGRPGSRTLSASLPSSTAMTSSYDL